VGGASEFAIRSVSSPEEMKEIGRLRYHVHVEELGKRPASADHDAKILLDELDPQCDILYVTRGDEVVATLRTLYGDSGIPSDYRSYFDLQSFGDFPEHGLSFCSRLMIKKAYRRGPLLNEILVSSYIRGRQKGAQLTFIGCAPSLIPLYEILGFRRYKPGIFRTDLGNDFAMVLMTDDLDYLKQVGSPWAKIAEQFPIGVGRNEWFRRSFPRYSAPTSCRVMGLEDFLDSLAQQINAAEVDLLQGIEVSDLQPLLKSGVILDLKPGDYVVREGDYGTELFVVLDGGLEVRTRQPSGNSIAIESLGKGQVFGEMAFITRQPRSADVVCTSDSRLLSVSQSFFENLVTSNPAVSSRLLLNLTRILIDKIHLSRNMLRNAV
jgi:hypothetical protein